MEPGTADSHFWAVRFNSPFQQNGLQYKCSERFTNRVNLMGCFFFFWLLLLPGPAQHSAVLPRLRLAQVCVRCHHVGVHSDRRQLHGGAVCPARRGILPKVLQVCAPVRVACFFVCFCFFITSRSCCGPFPKGAAELA